MWLLAERVERGDRVGLLLGRDGAEEVEQQAGDVLDGAGREAEREVGDEGAAVRAGDRHQRRDAVAVAVGADAAAAVDAALAVAEEVDLAGAPEDEGLVELTASWPARTSVLL
jgi:hypothetical protein